MINSSAWARPATLASYYGIRCACHLGPVARSTTSTTALPRRGIDMVTSIVEAFLATESLENKRELKKRLLPLLNRIQDAPIVSLNIPGYLLLNFNSI